VFCSPPVVVGYDGSASARAALRYAAGAAASRNRPLHVLGAHDCDPERVGSMSPQALFREAADLVHPVLASERVTFSHPPGSAGGALISASWGADLLVVGRGAIGAFGGALRSVALDVLGDAGCPVVVVADVAEHRPGPVVAGVDLVSDPTDALIEAFTEAHLRDRELVVVHAWQGLLSVGLPRFLHSDHVPVAVCAELAEAVRPFREKYPDVAVSEHCRAGSTTAVLLDAGDAAALLVVGANSHGPLSGLLRGSVSQDLVRRSACPVLIARAHFGL
jgi:nucleotide-binding universal stress UspA family protein